MTSPRRPNSSSGLVLVLLLAALAVGAAASIVAADRNATSPPVPGHPSSEVFLSNGVIVLGCIILFLSIVVPLVYDRVRGGTSLPGRAVAVALVVVLALIIFVVAARYLGAGGGLMNVGPGHNQTNSTLPGIGVNNSNNSTLGAGGTISVWGLHFPAWALFPVVAIVAVLVALVAVPRARMYLQDRAVARSTSDPDGEEVRGALGEAALELASGSDPREVILRLYARLLRRVEPITGNVDHATPEEIRSAHLIRVGIRPDAAEALTRLFEEARYSTHPLGPDAAARATRAIAHAERDLARDAPLP